MKFIITDPCYIMDKKQYNDICENGANFEEQNFPLKSKHRETKEPIIFHIIDGTGSDGSIEYKKQFIGVDSGMLCIAESKEWKENSGSTFESIEEAKKAFNFILNKFKSF